MMIRVALIPVVLLALSAGAAAAQVNGTGPRWGLDAMERPAQPRRANDFRTKPSAKPIERRRLKNEPAPRLKAAPSYGAPATPLERAPSP